MIQIHTGIIIFSLIVLAGCSGIQTDSAKVETKNNNIRFTRSDK